MRSITDSTADKQTSVNSLLLGLAFRTPKSPPTVAPEGAAVDENFGNKLIDETKEVCF